MRAEALRITDNTTIDGIRLGSVVELGRNQSILVDFPGNRAGPLPAMLSSSVDPEDLCPDTYPERQVILGFHNGDPRCPIVLGFLGTRDKQAPDSQTKIELVTDPPEELIVDGRKLLLHAAEEIVLRCGKGSIVIRSDGKIIIKGTNVVSRATVTNKIKGGAVRIN